MDVIGKMNKVELEKPGVKTRHELLKQIEEYLENADREKEDLRREIETKESGNRSLQEECRKRAEDNEKLKIQIKRHTNEIEKLQKLNKTFKLENEQLSKKFSDEKTENNKLRIHIQQQSCNLQLQNNKLQQNAQKIQEQNVQLRERMLTMKEQFDQIHDLNKQIEEYQNIVQELERSRSTLTLSLSKLTGDQLARDNPNFVDLADINRPTKLAERYSELYDNEWTDAFEEISEKWKTDEDVTVKKMLDILKEVYGECRQLTEPYRGVLTKLRTVEVKINKGLTEGNSTQTDWIKRRQFNKTDEQAADTLLSFQDKRDSHVNETEDIPEISGRSNLSGDHGKSTFNDMKSAVFNVKLPPGFEMNEDTGEATAEVGVYVRFTAEQLKTLSDMKKLCACELEEKKQISKIIAQKIAIERNIDIKDHEKLMSYIAICARLCWYMLIQEPPVVIGFVGPTEDTVFEKDTYKVYTKVGKYLDFVVWPPLYLHQDGPMLCKGTAQGKKKI